MTGQKEPGVGPKKQQAIFMVVELLGSLTAVGTGTCTVTKVPGTKLCLSHSPEHKQHWGNLSKTGKFYKHQHPGCDMILYLQDVTIGRNSPKCTRELSELLLPSVCEYIN